GITPDYLGAESAAVRAISGGSATNNGLITLSSSSNGAYGFMADDTNIQMINNGIIDVNTDGDGGKFIPDQSIGIFAKNK
uniref:hypothetical protein n=1 Tax=Enterobacter hormaechei TaxID=158836 RepID=UPI0020401B49